MSVIEKEDWKSFMDLVSNAKQVVSSVQDVARKLADYTKFRNNKESIGKYRTGFIYWGKENRYFYHF